MEERRVRLWRSGEFFGLVTDEPKARVGSPAWWRASVVVAACLSVGLVVASLL